MNFGGSEDTLINYHAFDGNPVPAGSHLFKAPIQMMAPLGHGGHLGLRS